MTELFIEKLLYRLYICASCETAVHEYLYFIFRYLTQTLLHRFHCNFCIL